MPYRWQFSIIRDFVSTNPLTIIVYLPVAFDDLPILWIVPLPLQDVRKTLGKKCFLAKLRKHKKKKLCARIFMVPFYAPISFMPQGIPPPLPREVVGIWPGGGGANLSKTHPGDRGNGQTAPPRGRERSICLYDSVHRIS